MQRAEVPLLCKVSIAYAMTKGIPHTLARRVEVAVNSSDFATAYHEKVCRWLSFDGSVRDVSFRLLINDVEELKGF